MLSISGIPSASSLANTFLDFFKDEIDRIRTRFLPSYSFEPFLFPPAPPPKMINFIPPTLAEIYKLIISASENKECPLDSIPAFLLKLASMNSVQSSQILSISLFLKEFFHRHLQALVQPLLKNPSPSTAADLNNFRPISNLILISKILEKVVAPGAIFCKLYAMYGGANGT